MIYRQCTTYHVTSLPASLHYPLFTKSCRRSSPSPPLQAVGDAFPFSLAFFKPLLARIPNSPLFTFSFNSFCSSHPPHTPPRFVPIFVVPPLGICPPCFTVGGTRVLADLSCFSPELFPPYPPSPCPPYPGESFIFPPRGSLPPSLPSCFKPTLRLPWMPPSQSL